jgi:hypothetical protein
MRSPEDAYSISSEAKVITVSPETRIALKNYDWMIRNRGLNDVELDWNTDTLIYGDGGGVIELLCEPGFTPATNDGVTPA